MKTLEVWISFCCKLPRQLRRKKLLITNKKVYNYCVDNNYVCSILMSYSSCPPSSTDGLRAARRARSSRTESSRTMASATRPAWPSSTTSSTTASAGTTPSATTGGWWSARICPPATSTLCASRTRALRSPKQRERDSSGRREQQRRGIF